jgi:CheY-like chemotaxis protein
MSVLPARSPQPRPLVVVAEDDGDARAMLGIMLEFSGFDVVLTGDGRAALDAVLAHGPDALVSDMNMPDLDGLGLCQAVRALHAGDSLPVIIWSSAAVDDPRLVEAIGLGGVAFVSKSVAVTQIDAALRRTVRATDLECNHPDADVGPDQKDQGIELLPVGAA